MKNDTLLVALAFIIVILCLLVCVVALWQPANPVLPTFSPSTSAPTVEQTQASTPPVPEPTEPVSTVPTTTAAEETTTATVHEHSYTGKVCYCRPESYLHPKWLHHLHLQELRLQRNGIGRKRPGAQLRPLDGQESPYRNHHRNCRASMHPLPGNRDGDPAQAGLGGHRCHLLL